MSSDGFDKKFLVTGSSSGIGFDVTGAILAARYNVIGVSEKDFYLDDGIYRHEVVDQSYPEQIKALYEKLKSEDVHLNGLVLNAGVVPKPCGIDDITEESINKVIDVNLKGTFYMLKYLGQLVKDGGSIVLVSSVNGVIGEPYAVMYSATKAGIISLMKSFARYYGKRNIRVNSVSPGLIDTPLTADSKELDSLTTDLSIIKRRGDPAEVANTILFLLYESSTFITGQNIIVDGGFSLK